MEIRSNIAPAFLQSVVSDKYYMIVDGKWVEISKEQYEKRDEIKWVKSEERYSETNK